jgi:hypothetical protein
MAFLTIITTIVILFLPIGLSSPTGLAPISQLRATDPSPLLNATSPAAQVNASVPVIFTQDRNGEDKCGVSSFIGGTTDASPTIEDCITITHNVAKDGRWEVEAVINDQHQIAQWGTCAFGVQAVLPFGDKFFYVGNPDIIDVIHDSIDRFGRDGKVGSMGTMICCAALLG